MRRYLTPVYGVEGCHRPRGWTWRCGNCRATPAEHTSRSPPWDILRINGRSIGGPAPGQGPFPCFQEVFDRHLADHFQDAPIVDRLNGLAVIRFVDFVLDGPGMVYVMDDIVLPRLDLLVRLQQLHVDMLLFQERYSLDEPSMVFQDQGHHAGADPADNTLVRMALFVLRRLSLIQWQTVTIAVQNVPYPAPQPGAAAATP